MSFINKKWRKDIGENAVNALLRITGAGVTTIALNKLTEDESTNLKKTIANISGPGMFLLGTAVDIFAGDDKIRAFGQGMATLSALFATAKIAPSVGEFMGLAGVNPIMNGTPGIMNGLGATTMQSNIDTPEEIANIVDVNPDGKIFDTVADYIDQNADAAIEVNGLAATANEQAGLEYYAESML